MLALRAMRSPVVTIAARYATRALCALSFSFFTSPQTWPTSLRIIMRVVKVLQYHPSRFPRGNSRKVTRFVRADFRRIIGYRLWQDLASVDGNLFDIIKKYTYLCRRNLWQVIMPHTSTQDVCTKSAIIKENYVCLLFLRFLFVKYSEKLLSRCGTAATE